MYQAIVFLPLLGAVLAAIISLAGAHARHPGGSPAPGAESPVTGLTPEHPHGAPMAAGHASAVHVSHDEPESEQPPAAGSRSAELVTTTFLFISMVLSWIAFVRVGFGHQDVRETLMPFIDFGRPQGRLGAAGRCR